MDLASDVADIVIKEMQRKDGESPFIFMMDNLRYTRNDTILFARACLVMGGLQFQLFTVARNLHNVEINYRSTFPCNVKTQHTECDIFKQYLQNYHSHIDASDNIYWQIRKAEGSKSTLISKYRYDKENEFKCLHKAFNTYLEICECNNKNEEPPEMPGLLREIFRPML